MQIRMDEKGRILFMATYVISDIHGEYERFMELLEEIELKDTDTLYVCLLYTSPSPRDA